MTVHYQLPLTGPNYGEELEWDAESLYTTVTAVSRGNESLEQILPSRRASTLSASTVDFMSSAGATLHVPTHSTSMKDVLLKSLAFVTMLPRISSARKELATVQRKAFPTPLYRQKRVLDDLLELAR